MKRSPNNHNLALGIGLTYLGLVVLLPLSAVVLKGLSLDWHTFWNAIATARVLAACRLTFGAALFAALVNTVTGLLLAWVLARYRFPGRRLLDALVDLPFALPTAVAGIALAGLYAPDGWIGQCLTPFGIQISYTRLGVFVALLFVGLPFVVRSVQPVIEDLDPALEECASCLGASRGYTFRRVILPTLAPALAGGFAMAFARGIGEYGSVIFIAGNIPEVSEIVPLLIVARLEQYDYAGATALAVAMLCVSFVLLLSINLLQGWKRRRRGGD
ncbi:MAG: sulfate ABC transporter permease subunit CysT [Kiritimatiellia bacterium]